MESQFGIIEGVIRTRVGYAGGLKKGPTYKKMGDHTETVQVDFDPTRITYSQLLDIFWKSHNPMKGSWSQQYLNAAFYHNESQHQQAMASKIRLSKQIGEKIKTRILPLNDFTNAEDYHQKYLLKGRDVLVKELRRMYPRHQDFMDSTAVARLNGYAGGYGNSDQLSKEIEEFGLSAEGKRILVELVQKP